jgi:integral membrane protein
MGSRNHMGLEDNDLPGFWRCADNTSIKAQKTVLLLVKLRFFGLIFAALLGVIASVTSWKFISILISVCFLMILLVEALEMHLQPNQNWYSGRALAESAKTLAWRFAVCGAPFDKDLSPSEAKKLLRERIDEVSKEASDKIIIDSDHPIVTEAMVKLRQSSFEERKKAYISQRLENQYVWYANKAKWNQKRATYWKIILITGEFLATGIAGSQYIGLIPINIAGLLSTIVGCASTWIAVKQFSNLASAYSITASELAILKSKIEDITDPDKWAIEVDDAEEAISREHTLWLASRIGRIPARSKKP